LIKIPNIGQEADSSRSKTKLRKKEEVGASKAAIWERAKGEVK